MSTHVWLRNGLPAFLIPGLWLKPPCRVSVGVLNELAFAAAYIAVSIAIMNVRAYLGHRRAAAGSGKALSQVVRTVHAG